MYEEDLGDDANASLTLHQLVKHVAEHPSAQGLDAVSEKLAGGADIDSRNDEDLTPLMLAVQYTNVALIDLLIFHSDLTAMHGRKGRTAVHIAVEHNNLTAVAMLACAGAKVSYLEQVNYHGSPLAIAIASGFEEMALQLLKYELVEFSGTHAHVLRHVLTGAAEAGFEIVFLMALPHLVKDDDLLEYLMTSLINALKNDHQSIAKRIIDEMMVLQKKYRNMIAYLGVSDCYLAMYYALATKNPDIASGCVRLNFAGVCDQRGYSIATTLLESDDLDKLKLLLQVCQQDYLSSGCSNASHALKTAYLELMTACEVANLPGVMLLVLYGAKVSQLCFDRDEANHFTGVSTERLWPIVLFLRFVQTPLFDRDDYAVFSTADEKLSALQNYYQDCCANASKYALFSQPSGRFSAAQMWLSHNQFNQQQHQRNQTLARRRLFLQIHHNRSEVRGPGVVANNTTSELAAVSSENNTPR